LKSLLNILSTTHNLERRHSDIAPMSKEEEEEENDDDWIDITRSRSLSTSSQIPLNPINVLVWMCFLFIFLCLIEFTPFVRIFDL